MGKFSLGQTVMTRGIAEFMKEHDVNMYEMISVMSRHQDGDWGDVPEEDWQANDDALEHGGRLLSSYEVRGRKVWVITEWDRSATTVLFPEEY